jgi:glucose/arabinose dehydrogenase
MAVTTGKARASADQLRAAATTLRTLADRHGLSRLCLTADGTLFVHVDSESGYRPILAFVDVATQVLGAEPNVVSDQASVAATKLPDAERL